MQIRKVLFFERVCYSSVFVSFFLCPVFAKLFFLSQFFTATSKLPNSCFLGCLWTVSKG